MPLNFPTGPTVGQEYYYNGKWFRWDGVAWKQLNSTKERRINEYTNFYEVPTSNSVNLDVRKYNYFKVNVDENTVITIPTAQSYYKFMLELKSGFTSSAQRWDISTATYDNVSFSVSGQDTNPFGITFKPDGTKMYMVGFTNDRVYQYTLSTPWDISSATYDTVSFLVSGQDTNPIDITFKPDGTKMYVLGNTNDRVYQYTLSTPWNLATATYDSVSFLVSGQDTNPYSITFKPDGTKMYVLGFTNDRVYQYTLSTPWDISSATYDTVSFLLSGQDTAPVGLAFKPDGTKMYMVGNTTDRVYQYTLTDPLTISWSDNVKWANNVPTVPLYKSSLLFEFTTYDGRTWVPVSLTESIEV